MGTDSSSATVRHFQFRGTDDRSFENIGEMRNDFLRKILKSLGGFYSPPPLLLSSPRPPLEYSHRAKIKIRPRPSPFQWEEEGPPTSPPLQSRTIFIYIKEKFQKEKRKAHCRYLINFDRFYPGLLFERREPTPRRWGGYDPPTRSVTRHRGKTEVNSNVARRTLRKDGEKRRSTDKKKKSPMGGKVERVEIGRIQGDSKP